MIVGSSSTSGGFCNLRGFTANSGLRQCLLFIFCSFFRVPINLHSKYGIVRMRAPMWTCRICFLLWKIFFVFTLNTSRCSMNRRMSYMWLEWLISPRSILTCETVIDGNLSDLPVYSNRSASKTGHASGIQCQERALHYHCSYFEYKKRCDCTDWLVKKRNQDSYPNRNSAAHSCPWPLAFPSANTAFELHQSCRDTEAFSSEEGERNGWLRRQPIKFEASNSFFLIFANNRYRH